VRHSLCALLRSPVRAGCRRVARSAGGVAISWWHLRSHWLP
jgi:hypothetical protein